MTTTTLNFNVGVLGHVDSGKTSLAKSLSTVASTACFDKNPQSKERGITLDLGFSSFCIDFPNRLNENELQNNYSTLQFTLVDCPGHASLIRTIIGGAQIIDLMILVVDVTKGIQTQTAECLVIGEISCDKMLVVLNKIDLIPLNKRQSTIDKMSKRLTKTLESTRFANSTIISVAAKPGDSSESSESLGIQELIATLTNLAFIPKRSTEGKFIFSVDHCFSIKGQGTVMTGTIIQGSVSINDSIEISSLKITKKVKSMQMFRKPVEKAKQGDRVGICVTQFDPKLLERGIVSTPGYIVPAFAVIASVQKIAYFKSPCNTKSKFHISMFHETTLARCTFFNFDNDKLNLANSVNSNKFDFQQEYKYLDELDNTSTGNQAYALLEFEHPVSVNVECLLIGSRLDTDSNANICRLAFHGKVLEVTTDKHYSEILLPRLKIFKCKSREGQVERMANEYEVIGKNIFKKETNIQNFIGLKITLSTGESGIIESGFGQSGKVKIRIPGGLKEEALTFLSSKKKEKLKEIDQSSDNNTKQIKIKLDFKRYVYDPAKKMMQT